MARITTVVPAISLYMARHIVLLTSKQYTYDEIVPVLFVSVPSYPQIESYYVIIKTYFRKYLDINLEKVGIPYLLSIKSFLWQFNFKYILI